MNSADQINALKNEIIECINKCSNLGELKIAQETHLSKKAPINGLMSKIKEIPNEEKAAYGQLVNKAKTEVNEALNNKFNELNDKEINEKLNNEKIDISIPGVNYKKGAINPYFLIQNEIIDTFVSMGYGVTEGPDVESDYYNFERMNIPQDHPAREMQDSFFINEKLLLRTHTSPGQAHAMDNSGGKPIKIICPGKVYRKDDDDVTHSHQFGQVEGLVIGKGISMANLKATLELFLKKMFGEKREVRLRSSYFPFTEPSVEVDISCAECHGKGCPTCKGSGYIEILGAGMVHPNVLRMSGYDPEIYSGFAFGIGIERVAMLRYGIDDIRRFYQGDVRFIKQFERKVK